MSDSTSTLAEMALFIRVVDHDRHLQVQFDEHLRCPQIGEREIAILILHNEDAEARAVEAAMPPQPVLELHHAAVWHRGRDGDLFSAVQGLRGSRSPALA